MKYIVKLNYHYFVFYDANEAMEFAEKAKSHYFDKKENALDVVINIEFDDINIYGTEVEE